VTEIYEPRIPGIGTGVVALAIGVLPAVWISTYLILTGVAGTKGFQQVMLAAEPIALPILGALAIVVAIFALWRDTRVGRLLGAIAIGVVVLQAAAIAALILL